MAIKTGVFIEGSYFCEKCNREYDKEGTCECGEKITFISMHSNRYLSVWMKSRRVAENEDAKKIDDNIADKGETNMSLDDKVKKLKELLEQFPEMANPNDFQTNRPVVTLFNMGDNPDDIDINQVGTQIHIRVKGRYMITVSGVNDHIQREKNYPGHFTDIVVDRYGDKDKPRDVIITLVHKQALTVEEIELTRPVCTKCGTRTELVDGCVFFYIYRCPKCGEEVKI